MSDTKESQPHPIHGPDELQVLQLLNEVRLELVKILDSLAGHCAETMEREYVWWACVQVNRAAAGFYFLRESGRTDSSKLLVRPAIEPVFSSVAVIKSRGFLFRKAYTELLEDKKLVRTEPAALAKIDSQLDELEKEILKRDPTYPIERKEVQWRYTAELAGLVAVYDTAYRLYSQFTHGAFRAVEGNLNQVTDSIDTAIVAWAVIMMLDLMKEHSPVSVPDTLAFKKRLPAPGWSA